MAIINSSIKNSSMTISAPSQTNMSISVSVSVSVLEEDHHHHRLKEAAKLQASSYSTRHSTIGAASFLFDWINSNSNSNSNHSNNNANTNANGNADTIPSRVKQLVQHYKHNSHLATREPRAITITLGGTGAGAAMEARRIALTAALVEAAPSNVWTSFQHLFEKILKVHIRDHSTINNNNNIDKNNQQDPDEESSDDDDDGDDGEQDLTLDFNAHEFYENLKILQWLNPHNPAKTDVLTKILHRALYQTIHKYVAKKITGIYDQDATNLFNDLLDWKTKVLMPLLQQILCCSESSTGQEINTSPTTHTHTHTHTLLQEYNHKLKQTISECYCTIRSNEIFDIIADYPDSLPSVIDLNLALCQAQKVSTIVHALKQAFRKRLLHPGAQSGQILQVYMNTIKVMRVFDPSDCLLDTVAEDVRAYLRGRSDTVRCIITSLTDDESESDLYEELQRHDAVPLDQAQYDSDDDDEPPDMNHWNPAPSQYYQRISGAMSKNSVPDTDRNADLLAMLVRIYGSNDLFVDEYRIMLADKLLANVDFDTDREVHNLELLKLRFGETSMRQCEIMIKDMDDSKRIATNVHSTLEGKYSKGEGAGSAAGGDNPVVDAAIISHIFWPPLQKESMKNHPRIQTQLDEFSDEYAKYKNPRKLVWFQQLGQVQIELEVIEHDGEISTKEFTCSPLHATLISHFEDNDGCWTARGLSNETGVAEDIIKKKIGYWVTNNVVKIVRGSRNIETTYELASYHDASADDGDEFYDEDEGIVVSLSGQEEEEWEAYESYIAGMLSNLGQLPLDRIHNMLKTFVTGSDHKYNKTPQQLQIFLQQLCKGDKLEFGADGMYKLVKK